jgi:hypothetical protein
VRRLNLIQTAINHARREWRINIVNNPASAEQCARPKGADRKRDRILLPAQRRRVESLDQADSRPAAVQLACEETSAPAPQHLLAEMQLSEEERLLGACLPLANSARKPSPVFLTTRPGARRFSG